MTAATRQDEAALELAWTALHATHELVARALERELGRRHGIGLSGYKVLRRLTQAPEAELSLSDLAADVLLSPSRASRVVDQLEELGYLERRPCRFDGRAVCVRITDTGHEFVAGVHRTCLETLRRELVSRSPSPT